MRAAIESQEMAQHHKSVAVSLQNALDTSIFSDDRDAVEALEARIAEREAESERMRFINKAHAKYIKTGKLDAGLTPAETAQIQNYKPAHSWEPHPYAPFQLSNLRERITADKKRLETIKMRNARTERAKNSGGVVIEKSADGARCQVSFAEKPAREILNDLRGADFHFSGGGTGINAWSATPLVADASVAAYVDSTNLLTFASAGVYQVTVTTRATVGTLSPVHRITLSSPVGSIPDEWTAGANHYVDNTGGQTQFSFTDMFVLNMQAGDLQRSFQVTTDNAEESLSVSLSIVITKLS
jgi:hypothetical protein